MASSPRERRWSGIEFTIVVVVAFGLFTFSSLWWALSGQPLPVTTAADLRGMLMLELVLSCFLAVYLRLRGWAIADVTRPYRHHDWLVGAGLAAACIAGTWAMTFLLQGLLRDDAMQTMAMAPDVGVADILALCMINSIYEEVFACAYVITALRGLRNPWIAINASVAIRLAYHTYQGAPGVPGILCVGLVFALWYARTGQLWPLVVAHGLLNLLAFL